MQPKTPFLPRLALLLVAALCLVLLPATSATAATFATAPVPTITGTAKIASTLTAKTGSWTPLPRFTYQWKRGGAVITGATAATYKPAIADAGTTLTVTVTGTKAGYTTVSKTSAPTATITASTFTAAPVPTISGTAKVGSTLTAKPGTWTPTAAFAYKWSRNGAVITGATAATYKPVAADIGTTITVTVTGTKAGYTTTVKTSAPTAAVAAASAASPFTAAPVPTITGTAKVGSTLTAKPGTWTPVPTFSYQWARDGISITRATSATYIPVADDTGTRITVTVTGTKAGYTSTSKTSTPTTTVAGGPIAGTIITGTITTDTAWTAAPGRVYVVKGDVIIAAKATLTIDAGTVIKFDTDSRLEAAGAIIASGTTTNPVLLTSLRDDAVGGDTNGDGAATIPTPGDWSGVDAEPGAFLSMNAVRLSYGSAVSAQDAAAMKITNSTLEANITAHRSSGTEFAGEQIEITGNILRAGTINVTSRNDVATAVPIRVSSNTVTGNVTGDTHAITINDWHLRPSLITGNAATGNAHNTLSITGILIENWIIPSSGPSIVIGVVDEDDIDLGFFGSLIVNPGVTMTVPAGATLAFDQAEPSMDGIYVKGSFAAPGTSTAPVVMTAIKADSVAGATHKESRESEPVPSGSRIAQGTVDDGPCDCGSYVPPRPGILGSLGSSVSINFARTYGNLEIMGYNAKLFKVSNSYINGRLDVQRGEGPEFAANTIEVTNNSLRGDAFNVISENTSTTAVPMSIVSNTVTGASDSFAMGVRDERLQPSRIVGNKAVGNKRNAFFLGGTLVEDWTVPVERAPFLRNFTIAAGVTLTAPAGSTFKSPNFFVRGSLVTQGTAANPVTFTVFEDDSAGGDSNEDGSATTPAVEYWTPVTVLGQGASANLIGVTIKYSRLGLNVRDGARVTMRGSFRECTTAIASDGALVDARNVDWGTSDGPGPGSIIGPGVTYDPWIGSVDATRPATALVGRSSDALASSDFARGTSTRRAAEEAAVPEHGR
jgi:hypothetical protein